MASFWDYQAYHNYYQKWFLEADPKNEIYGMGSLMTHMTTRTQLLLISRVENTESKFFKTFLLSHKRISCHGFCIKPYVLGQVRFCYGKNLKSQWLKRAKVCFPFMLWVYNWVSSFQKQNHRAFRITLLVTMTERKKEWKNTPWLLKLSLKQQMLLVFTFH